MPPHPLQLSVSNTSSFTPGAPCASLVGAREKSTCLLASLGMPASTEDGGMRLGTWTLGLLKDVSSVTHHNCQGRAKKTSWTQPCNSSLRATRTPISRTSVKMSCLAHKAPCLRTHPPTHGKEWMRCVKSMIYDTKYTQHWPRCKGGSVVSAALAQTTSNWVQEIGVERQGWNQERPRRDSLHGEYIIGALNYWWEFSACVWGGSERWTQAEVLFMCEESLWNMSAHYQSPKKKTTVTEWVL